LPPTSPEAIAGVDELPELRNVITRVVAARVVDPDTVEDLVQETLARVLEAGSRLDDEAVTPYAIVTAQNLVRSLARFEYTRKRHSHRLVDLREPVRPEDVAVRREEAAAVNAALARLPSTERETVVAHEIGGVDTATLARRLDSSPGGVAVRLARARAKLRVEYVMALRKAEPPTPRCRSVLIALSGGDRRRQIELKAGEHLLECRYCAELSEPLIERRRSLASLAPIAALTKLAQIVRQAARSGRVQAAAAGTTVAAVGMAAVLAAHQPAAPTAQPHKPQPQPSSVLQTESGRNLLHLPHRVNLKHFAGRAVEGRWIRVESVPADEGFWIGVRHGDRLWVQISNPGESSAVVRPGDLVSFHGRVVRNGPNFSGRIGVDATEGAAHLRQQGYHITVEHVRDRRR
jgi:RNA polymerase sigma factor (sigma-70 family)